MLNTFVLCLVIPLRSTSASTRPHSVKFSEASKKFENLQLFSNGRYEASFCFGKSWIHIWPQICPTNQVSRIHCTKNIAKTNFNIQFTNEVQISLQWPLEVRVWSTAKFWLILMKLNCPKLKEWNNLKNMTNCSNDGRTHILTSFAKIEFFHIRNYYYYNCCFLFQQLDVKQYTTKTIRPKY